MLLPAWYTSLSRIYADCPYYRDNFIGPLFILIDYYPILMSVTMIVISVYRSELMFRLLSLMMTSDAFINWILREAIIKMPSRTKGCGNDYEMPSFATQHLAFITFVLQYILLRRKKKVNTNLLILIHLMVFVGLMARVYIGINTSAELYVGTLFGVVQGALVCVFVVDNIIAKRDSLLKWCHGTGWKLLKMEDTIFGDDDNIFVRNTITHE